jgi:hypothetical protein
MFNLPLPTDSLYKFSFMFGLLLIVYSLIYRDNHLSPFDKNQVIHKLDSVQKKMFDYRIEPQLFKNYVSFEPELHKELKRGNTKYAMEYFKQISFGYKTVCS